MVNKHWGIYGSVKMLRVYCSECKGMTLVRDGVKLCCDAPAMEKSMQSKIMSGGVKRKRPSAGESEKILTVQDNKCLYCNQPFGTPYIRNGKSSITRLCWDHLIPYSFTESNKYNFVAACNVCNGIKSNKMFETVEEVFHYVRYTRKKKGYTFYEDLPAMQEKV